jgi:hypothetical protein
MSVGSPKSEIRISKYETNSNNKCPNDKNKTGFVTSDMRIVWIIAVFVIIVLFRISIFGFSIYAPLRRVKTELQKTDT